MVLLAHDGDGQGVRDGAAASRGGGFGHGRFTRQRRGPRRQRTASLPAWPATQ